MKHFNITFLLTVLMSMVGAKALAHDIGVKNADGVTIYYRYNSDKTSVYVTYRGDSYSSYSNEYKGVVNIPSSITYNGKEYSVTSIGGSAFYGCSGLTSVTIPNSVTSIDGSAFSGCSGLTSITIPNSVTSIDIYAFAGCSGLTSIKIEDGNPTYDSRGNCNAIIETASNTLIRGCNTTVIPNSVTSIGNGAFGDCSGLTSVTIPNSVTTLGNYAFAKCTNLKSVVIGNGIKEISAHALGTCNYLESLTIGSSVQYISDAAFQHDYSYTNHKPLKVIWLTNSPPKGFSYAEGSVNYVPNNSYGFDNSKVYPFLSSMFTVDGVKYVPVSPSERICDAIAWDYEATPESIIIGNFINYKGVILTVKSIGPSAFYGCSKLQRIDIPNSVERVGSSAFYGCTNMQSVMIGSNVKTIDNDAFSGCTSLENITIPKAVTSIGHYAFNGCTALKNVVMEDSGDDTILSLGSNGSSPLFSSCPLDYVYIGRKISYDMSSSKGYSPFAQNATLTKVEINDRETEILKNEFYGCTNLKDIKFGDNITKINDRAFSGCSSLDYFVVGPKVENIGVQAFSGCSSMTKLFSRATTPPVCGSQALDDINKWNCKLTIPPGSLAAYQAADQWKEFFFVEEGDMTPIDRVEADKLKEADIIAIYDLNGQKKTSLQRGLNIVKMSDGRTKKIVVK